MMAATATMDLPLYVKADGKEYEILTLTVDLKVSKSGAVSAPRPRDIKRALRKAVR